MRRERCWAPSRKIWLGVRRPASQVDPTALGFAPEDGFGSRGQSPTILGTSLDPESASARQDAQPPSDVEDELPVWSLAKRCVHPSEEQEDFKVRTQNRFEVLVPQEICNVKPELEAFDLTMADSDTESVEVPPPQNHGRVRRKLVLVSGTQQVEVPTQEPESEAEGCPSEQESFGR